MPAFAREAANVLARYGGIKLDHGLATLHRRVRATGNHRAAFQETLPRIGAFQPVDSQPAGRKMEIANRVRWLHRRNDTQLCEARKIRRIHDLRMLITPARFTNFSLFRRHCFHRLLVLIEHEAIGAISDRVRFYLNAFAQCVFQHWLHIFLFYTKKSRTVRRITVRLEQRSSAGSQRAVRDYFYCANVETISERANDRSFTQEPLGLGAWSIHR